MVAVSSRYQSKQQQRYRNHGHFVLNCALIGSQISTKNDKLSCLDRSIPQKLTLSQGLEGKWFIWEEVLDANSRRIEK